jgi:hypothetical protein
MELARDEERINGIAEYEEVRLPDGFQCGRKVLLQHLDSLPGIQIIELVPGKLLFQKKASMQRNGILPLGLPLMTRILFLVSEVGAIVFPRILGIGRRWTVRRSGTRME